MPWNPSLNELRDTLAELYPDVADARRVARTALLPISRIDLAGRAVNVWQSILEEAERQCKVEDVVALALGEYPKYAPLKAAREGYAVYLERQLGRDGCDHRCTIEGPPTDLEQELSRANITLSDIQEKAARRWLKEDRAYQALAKNCLKALAGKRVRDPVPLDAINGTYKVVLGRPSDEYLEYDQYNDLDKIKTAILWTWKDRHLGDPKKSFDEIIV